MPLNRALIGVPGEWRERSWTSTDALLYAVGVGAGLGDPLAELEFTTENTPEAQQQVLPTFGVVLAHVPIPSSLGHFDRAYAVTPSSRSSSTHHCLSRELCERRQL